MQIYKEMDIGTAKVTKEEAEGIKHYLINIITPEERYTVANFKRDCEKAIEEILAKGKMPIIVGGTGLYVNSIIYGIDYMEMNFDEEYRNSLMKKAETEVGLEEIYEEAKKIDPEAIKTISKNDKKRIIRILEIFKATGKNKTEQELLSRNKDLKYDFRVFVVNMDRNKLYEKINKRVDLMIEKGLIEEVEEIYKKYKKFPTAMQGLGYKEVVEYLKNEITKEEMIEKIKKESRHYAKRQLTWFRKDKNFIWLNSEEDMQKNIDIILNNL